MIIDILLVSTECRVLSKYFTHAPESHACKGVDEWLSVRGFAPERNPESKEATGVRPWSFT